jgi:hypothetical protein
MKSPLWTYEQFVNFEEKAAAIYLRMASRFSPENPELSSFWLDMGMQEKQHAGLLQFCIAEELFAHNLPSEKDIEDIATAFTTLLARASDPNLTIVEAFRIALEVETSEVNAIYDKLTTPVHSSMYLLRRKVATSLPDHIGHLLEEARKCGVSGEMLIDLERATSTHGSH